MRKFHENCYDRFLRVITFAEKNADVFEFHAEGTETNLGLDLVSQLKGVAADVKSAGVTQAAGMSMTETTLKGALRDKLVRQMTHVKKSVIYVALERGTPGILGQFNLGQISSDRELIMRAESFSQALDQFGLGPDLERMNHPANPAEGLRASVAEFEAFEKTRHSTLQERQGATANLDELIAKGQKIVAGLDAIISITLQDSPERLAVWESVMHVRRPSRKAKKSKEEPTSAETPGEPTPTETAAVESAAVANPAVAEVPAQESAVTLAPMDHGNGNEALPATNGRTTAHSAMGAGV